jgi:RND family efflux transporter MFP subunit
VRVAALAPGVVERLLVVEDQLVAAGEPVAELVKDDARLAHDRAIAEVQLREAERAQAEAALEAATTRFEQPVHLEAQVRESQAALAEIATRLRNLPFESRRAQAQLQYAEKAYEGRRSATGAIAGLTVDAAESEMETAKALVEELQIRSDSLEKERAAIAARTAALEKQLELLADERQAKDEATAKRDAAEAQLAQARVAAAEAKLRLDRMTLRAPIDGRVYQLVGDPGTTLTGGMGFVEGYDGSTVITMYRPDMLQVRVDVRFEDVPHVSLGQPVEIENPALKEPLAGKVLFISSMANIQKNTLEVKVAIENSPSFFKPEMLMNVTFLAPESDQPAEPTEELRLYVPQEYVHEGDGGKFVWVADQSAGRVRRTPVQTGVVGNGGLVEITEGLGVSSRVIAAGHETLDHGDRIRVVGEERAAAETAGPAHGGSKTLNRLPQEGTH